MYRLTTFAIAIVASCNAFAGDRTESLNNALREFNTPGITSVGQPVSVLATRWGIPRSSMPVGQTVMYVWHFEKAPPSTGMYGQVARDGTVTMNSIPVSNACEIQVTTDAKGIITAVRKVQLVGAVCPIPIGQ